MACERAMVTCWRERDRRLSSSESAASAVNTFKRLQAGLHNEAAGVTAWRGEGKKKKLISAKCVRHVESVW